MGDGSLPHPLHSLLPCPLLLFPSKREGTFLLQEYFRRGIYFYYSFKLIPKTRRQGKLQSLQLYINSKTLGLYRVKTVIILAEMVSRSHNCKNMLVFQTLTFPWNNSTEAFATGSSASQHSDVTVRLFESDARVIERARLRVHSTWVSGNSTRLHADCAPVVILSVTVDLVSMFLLSCPGQSDFSSRQETSAQCTQLTLERLDLALHGGTVDGIATMKQCATTSTATQDRL